VVGAGTMGHGLAQVYAQGGFQVSLMDVKGDVLDRAMILIRSSLETMVEAGIIQQSEIQMVMGRIHPTISLEEAAVDADLAVEAVFESKEAKIEAFKNMDRECPPKTIFTSNVSNLNLYDFIETSRPDKVLITHWYAPPQIIPLIDVVKGPKTEIANLNAVVELLRRMGKKPIIFNKPVIGNALTRMQIAYQREVHFLLDNDLLSPQELDEAAIWGLALRMLVVGVVQRFDFGGLDVSARTVSKSIEFSTPFDYQPRKMLELVAEGANGVKAGRGFYDYKGEPEAKICHDRDLKLLKVLKFLQENDVTGPVLPADNK
jgi:3-hydroxybutyryl-CoA dehydrogenase